MTKKNMKNYPGGKELTHTLAFDLAGHDSLIIVCYMMFLSEWQNIYI